jgi:hypothetical protein
VTNRRRGAWLRVCAPSSTTCEAGGPALANQNGYWLPGMQNEVDNHLTDFDERIQRTRARGERVRVAAQRWWPRTDEERAARAKFEGAFWRPKPSPQAHKRAQDRKAATTRAPKRREQRKAEERARHEPLAHKPMAKLEAARAAVAETARVGETVSQQTKHEAKEWGHANAYAKTGTLPPVYLRHYTSWGPQQ